MKKIIVLILLCCSMLQAEPAADTPFWTNKTAGKILEKYNAKYFTDFNSWAVAELFNPSPATGWIFKIRPSLAEQAVRELLDLKQDFYAVVIEKKYGYNDQDDKIAVFENTTDHLQVLKYTGVAGNDFDISNEEIILQFKKWSKEFRYRIIGTGFDFIIAEIQGPCDYSTLSREMYQICPDTVDQGTKTILKLEKQLKENNTMRFWWD